MRKYENLAAIQVNIEISRHNHFFHSDRMELIWTARVLPAAKMKFFITVCCLTIKYSKYPLLHSDDTLIFFTLTKL